MEDKEILVDTRSLKDAEGRLREYGYFILVGEKSVGNFSCEAYGVRIREAEGESAAVPDITVSAARIEDLITLLIRNTVTPTALADVVAEWL